MTAVLEDLQHRAFKTSADHGFHANDEDEAGFTPTRRMMLIAGEVNEAFEEMRSGHALDEIYFTYDLVHNGVKFKGLSEEQVEAITGLEPAFIDGCEGKPEGVGVEIADAVIRIFDFAETYGLNLDRLVAQKMAFNEGREFLHGRNF